MSCMSLNKMYENLFVGLSQSPTKSSSQLEIPMKESYSPRHSHHSSKHHHHHHSPVPTARKSPKRRTLQRHPVASSSSSSESLVPPRSQMSKTKLKNFYLFS